MGLFTAKAQETELLVYHNTFQVGFDMSTQYPLISNSNDFGGELTFLPSFSYNLYARFNLPNSPLYITATGGPFGGFKRIRYEQDIGEVFSYSNEASWNLASVASLALGAKISKVGIQVGSEWYQINGAPHEMDAEPYLQELQVGIFYQPNDWFALGFDRNQSMSPLSRVNIIDNYGNMNKTKINYHEFVLKLSFLMF